MTVISRQAFFPPDTFFRSLCRLLCALLTLAIQQPARAGFDLHLKSVSVPALTLEDVRVSASALSGGAASIRIARARLSGRELQDVQLDCADFSVLPPQHCHGGVLRARGAGPWPIEFSVSGAHREIRGSLRIEQDVRVDVTGTLGGGRPHLLLKTAGLDLGRLLGGEPAFKSYALAGRADIRAELTQTGTPGTLNVRVRLDVPALKFSSRDGLRAAEALSAVIDIDAQREGAGWSGQMSADWRGGELLWDSIYLRGGGTVLSSAFLLAPGTLDLSQIVLDLAGVGRLNGEVSLGREPMTVKTGRAYGTALDLQALNERIVTPMMSVRGWPAWTMQGRVDVDLRFDDAGVTGALLRLGDAELSDAAGRFSLRGVDAEFPWQRGGTSVMNLSVAHAWFGRIPAGPFALQVNLAPGYVGLLPVRIPVLDAGLRINALSFQRAQGRWSGDVSADLEPLSMPALTQALGLPRMAGSLAAVVPRVSWRDGVLSLDGQMLIQVFGGYFAARGLHVIEPFGTAPRVLADLEMRHVELDALTETFRFGRMTGRIDGDILGLELLRWVPMGFDARIHSSAGDYPRTISQRAVESITALGGPGAAAAIQRSFLGIFERFGYKRIGVSCRLSNGVCEMDGLERKGGGFVLIEGGGLPALSVVGYNHRVDWQELLDRLARVTDAKPVVQ